MRAKRLAFVDLETTGLNPFRHEITEIGIVLADQRRDLFDKQYLEFVSEHEILLMPMHIETADKKSLEISKYYNRDRSNALRQKEGLQMAADLLNGCIFVAQNVAFDWGFLQKAGNEYGIDLDSRVHYHKLDLASMVFGKHYHDPALFKFSLREMTEHFGVKNADAHTAIADARATFEVAKKVLES